MIIGGGGGNTDGDRGLDEGDCDDYNSQIYPGAIEICDCLDNNYDGVIDDRCDGCTDIDGDGWCIEDGDCDDNNAHIYPGHNEKRERWGQDNVDNDCNGIIDG